LPGVVAELHPMAVHLPIAIILLYPFFELAAAVTRKKELAVVALVFLGVGALTSLLATTTGEAAYDAAIAAGFEHAVLEDHESVAEMVPWLLLGIFGVRLFLALKASFGPWVGVGLGVAMAGFVLRVGQSGGDLVYEHGVGVEAGAGPPVEAEEDEALEAVFRDEAAEDVSDPHDDGGEGPEAYGASP